MLSPGGYPADSERVPVIAFRSQPGGNPPLPRAVPAVDVAVLDALIAEIGDGTPELRAMLLADFLADAPEQMTALVSAAAAGDGAAVSAGAHGLRSACALLGALRLADLLAELEQQAKSPQVELPSLVAPSAAEFDRVQFELTRLQAADDEAVHGHREG